MEEVDKWKISLFVKPVRLPTIGLDLLMRIGPTDALVGVGAQKANPHVVTDVGTMGH